MLLGGVLTCIVVRKSTGPRVSNKQEVFLARVFAIVKSGLQGLRGKYYGVPSLLSDARGVMLFQEVRHKEQPLGCLVNKVHGALLGFGLEKRWEKSHEGWRCEKATRGWPNGFTLRSNESHLPHELGDIWRFIQKKRVFSQPWLPLHSMPAMLETRYVWGSSCLRERPGPPAVATVSAYSHRSDHVGKTPS